MVSEYVLKNEAWDGAQAIFAKGYEKGKREAADTIDRLTRELAEARDKAPKQEQLDAIDKLDGALCNFLNIICDDLPKNAWTPWLREIVDEIDDAYNECHSVKAMDIMRGIDRLKEKP